MDSLGVKGRGKSWEDNEREKIGQESKRTGRKNEIGGARVERVELLDAGFNKIVEKVGHIDNKYFNDVQVLMMDYFSNVC